MNDRRAELIRYLLEQKAPTPSRKLRDVLDVSVRSVKNYVKDINSLSQEKVIYSSNQGYWINHDTALGVLEKFENLSDIPQTFKERAHFVIKKIVIDNEEVDVFDLTQELYISYSTVKSDILRMNQAFDSFNLKFEIINDKAIIIGDEKEKRRLISFIIFEEIPNYFMTQEILVKNFNQEDVHLLTISIEKLLNREDLKINDFAFMNLLMHILVLIVSVKNGRSLVKRESFTDLLGDARGQIVDEFIDDIERDFHISLNDLEKQEIHMLFQANVNYIPTTNIKKIEGVIERDILNSIDILIEEVYQHYGVHLNSEQFYLNFAIHLSNLYTRAKQKTFIKNPMVSLLKSDFPIVYEVAVYMSFRLGELLDITVNDDESAYIALHIGSELEGQKRNFSKVKTAILCPNYMNHPENLYRQVQKYFSDELNVILVTSNISDIEDQDIELLITTIPMQSNKNYSTIKVLPLLTDEQKLQLSSEIHELVLQRKKYVLVKNFDKYFSESFFYSSLEIDNRDDLLKYMCDELEKHDVVNEQYYDNVMERELASSTAFDLFAIPHSVYMDANKTNLSVAISQEGFAWGDKKVNIVLLASINYVERNIFASVYEAIISLFDYPELYSELWNIKTFEEFRNFIHSKMIR